MAPGELWQAGKLIHTIEDGKTHEGKLNGKDVKIEGKEWGFSVNDSSRSVGNSLTLDTGEIIIATKK